MVILAIDTPMFFATVGLTEAAQKARPEYPWPRFQDNIWKAGASAIVFLIAKSIVTTVVYPIVAPFVKDQDKPDLMHGRA
jgi:hypothetical protein